jgi:hypothetical protein
MDLLRSAYGSSDEEDHGDGEEEVKVRLVGSTEDPGVERGNRGCFPGRLRSLSHMVLSVDCHRMASVDTAPIILQPPTLVHRRSLAGEDSLGVLLATPHPAFRVLINHPFRLASCVQGSEPVALKPQVLSKPINAAPYVNPALRTIVAKPAFIPPTQKELTSNIKVWHPCL